ncbi:MAG: hypothetical protein AAF696_16080 [Bacteroidota bacterium]
MKQSNDETMRAENEGGANNQAPAQFYKALYGFEFYASARANSYAVVLEPRQAVEFPRCGKTKECGCSREE